MGSLSRLSISGCWFTCSPQGDALLLMSLADAVVTVPVNVMAGVAVVQINVGRTLSVGAGAELWQVAGVTRLSTHGSSWLQL